MKARKIPSWRKFSKGFARNIQHSYLGRVKVKLIELQKSNRSFEISKWSPSTKFCPCCGSLNTGITLSDRVYRCYEKFIKFEFELKAKVCLFRQTSLCNLFSAAIGWVTSRTNKRQIAVDSFTVSCQLLLIYPK